MWGKEGLLTIFKDFLILGLRIRLILFYISYLTSYILHPPGLPMKHPRLPSSASCRTQKWRAKPCGWVSAEIKKTNENENEKTDHLPYFSAYSSAYFPAHFPVSCQTTDQGTSQTILSSPNLSSTQFMRPALFRSILDGLKYNLSHLATVNMKHLPTWFFYSALTSVNLHTFAPIPCSVCP